MKMSMWKQILIGLALAVLSGVLFACSVPPRNVSILGWFAFLPLLVAARLSDRSLRASLFGMLTAICTAWVLVGRIENASQFANLLGAFGSLALVFAFAVGFASFASRRVNPALWPVFAGAAGVTGELLSRYVFPVSVAISQHSNLSALHIASFTGIWGVSFIIWFVPASIISFALRPARMWPALAAASLLFAAANFLPPAPGPTGRATQVAAIQAPDACNSAEATDKCRAEVVVWPELLMYPQSSTSMVAAKRNELYIVASFLQPAGKGREYNSVCMIAPNGKVIGRSQKVHLFGKEALVYARGRHPQIVKIGNYGVGMPICFDTEFTDITRRLVREGADILFVPNSDPEFPNNLFQHLHSAIIPFRAAENGVPIVWAEDRSLSLIVDGAGRVVARAPAFKITSVVSTVKLRSGTTFFTIAGDYFAYLCAAFMFMTVIGAIRGKARASVETSGN